MKARPGFMLLALWFILFLSIGTLGDESSNGCWNTKLARTPPETDTYQCGPSESGITKTNHWTLYWLDGFQKDWDVTDTGRLTCHISCWPQFDAPYVVDDGTTATWYDKTYSGYISNGQCGVSATPSDDHHFGHTCSCSNEGYSGD